VGIEKKIEFVIPVRLDDFDVRTVDLASANFAFIPFHENWSTGLQQLFEILTSINCPKASTILRTTAVPPFEKDVLSSESEEVYSNSFRLQKVPEVIYRFGVGPEFDQALNQNLSWPYKKINDNLVFSFHHPPSEILQRCKVIENGGDSWRDVTDITWTESGVRKRVSRENLLLELVRKSLVSLCNQRGLSYCPETNLHYFPDGLLDRNRFGAVLPDGKKISSLKVYGERKYYLPQNKSEYYRYQLAPTFFIDNRMFRNDQDESDLSMETAVALVRLKIRFTDTENVLLSSRKSVSRRKHLCKNWWNDDWFKRILAIVQFLSGGEKLVIGHLPSEQIWIDAQPLKFSISGGIDEERLGRNAYSRDEFLLREEEFPAGSDIDQAGDDNE